MTSDPLAYLTAKSHGLEEEAQSILEACGLTEDQISVPTGFASLKTPKPIAPTFKANWPAKPAATSSFEKALLGEEEAEEEEETLEEEVAEEDAAAEEDGVPENDEADFDL